MKGRDWEGERRGGEWAGSDMRAMAGIAAWCTGGVCERGGSDI